MGNWEGEVIGVCWGQGVQMSHGRRKVRGRNNREEARHGGWDVVERGGLGRGQQ